MREALPMVHDAKALDEANLLRLYAGVLDEMKERGMIRSFNAIPGDLGERFPAQGFLILYRAGNHR